MKLTVLRGFSLGGGIDVFEGETVTVPQDLSEANAEHYRRQGLLQPIMGEELLNKASLLAAIALGESVEVLNELVHPQETDPEIISAYQTRMAELDEPNH